MPVPVVFGTASSGGGSGGGGSSPPDATKVDKAGILYPRDYITGGAGTLVSPWTHSALPIVDNSVVEYGVGHWFSQLLITANHVSVQGRGMDSTLLHSVAGNTVIEYTTGDAGFSRFGDFGLIGPGKTDAGGKHGMYLHDMAIAPHSVVVERVFVHGFAGDGIREGKPGVSDQGNAFYACGVYDSWVEGCGGHCYSLCNYGPTSVFSNCVGIEIPNGRFNLYSDIFQGLIDGFGGCDNILPAPGSGSAVDGGGQIRITTSANVQIRGCNFEASGTTFVDLSGCSGSVSFQNNTWLDNNVREGVAARIAVNFTNPNLFVTFSGSSFNSNTQWANNVPVHGVPSGHFLSFDTQVSQVWIAGVAVPVSAMQSFYDSSQGYIPYFPLLRTASLAVNTPGAGAGLVVSNNGTPVFYVQSDGPTNNHIVLGGRNAAQMFNTTLYLGHDGDITFQVDSPFKFAANVGFNSAAPLAKPTVVGTKMTNPALTSLLSALAGYGLITDSST